MAIEGLKGIFRVPLVEKEQKDALNSQRRKKKKPKKNERKEEEGKSGRVDIRV